MRTQTVILTVITLLMVSGVSPIQAQSTRWVTGYVASWELNMTGSGGGGASNYGGIPYTAVDFDAMTHLLMFPAELSSTGTLNTQTEWDGSLSWGATLLQQRRKPFNDYAHAHGKSISLTIFVGGADWTTLIGNPASRARAIQTIKDSVIGATNQYDGVDWDMEPHIEADTANARIFFKELYDTLQHYHQWIDVSKKPLLTAAVYRINSFWKSVYPYFDQLNLMSYDMFGTWCTKTWHHCAVFTAGATDVGGNPLQSVQGDIQSRINIGIPKSKIGAGIAMGGGYRWVGGTLVSNPNEGVTAPLQAWITAPTKPIYAEEAYYKLRKEYIDTATTTIHYDAPRKCPYIGYDNPGSANDSYITFEDTSTVREIVTLADTMGIGGVMLWYIGGSYLPNTSDYYPEASYPGIKRDELLQAVKKAANGSFLPKVPLGSLTSSTQTVPAGGGTVTLTWTSVNATSASIDFVDSVKTVSLNGSVTVNVTSTKTFRLILSNGGLPVYSFVTVTVLARPLTGTITATPGILPSGGGPVNLVWTSQSAISASIDFIDSMKTVSLNGSMTVNVIATKTITLILSNTTASFRDSVIVTVEKEQMKSATTIRLYQNYPNPFNSITRIPYSIYKKSWVKLTILNLLGQRISTLINEEEGVGYYQKGFDLSRNENGEELTSGVYFYRLEINGASATKKLILLK